MAWTPTTPISVDMPGTAEWANVVQDNPVAIANGDAGAPKVQPRALSSNLIGARSASLTAYMTFNSVGDFEIIRAAVETRDANAASFVVSFSSNGGTTWGTERELFIGVAGRASLTIQINLETGSVSGVGLGGDALITVNSSVIVPSNVNAVRFRYSTGSGQTTMFLTAEQGR